MKKVLFLIAALSFGISLGSAQPPKDFKGMKFCIDQGHGGYNSNDRQIFPEYPDLSIVFWESESNYYKGVWLQSLLKARGATVFLTRPNKDSIYADSNDPDHDEPTLTARWQYANANNVHWFHSIHSNASGVSGSTANYTLVLLKEDTLTRQAQFPEALIMSDAIYRKVLERNRTTPYGVRLDFTFYGGPGRGYNLGVLKGLTMPGELSEGSFHDYAPETRRLLNNHYRKNETYGIFFGFLEYYGLPLDTLGVVAGTQVNTSGKPINGTKITLMPVNRTYNGDNNNNGYFFFDSLNAGQYTVLFQTPGYAQDTVQIEVSPMSKSVDTTSPANGDVQIPRNGSVTINFLKQMDTAAVRSAFSIAPSIDGTITWAKNNSQMIFTPKSLYDYKTTYTVRLEGMGTVSKILVFVDNKRITSTPYSFSFTTVTLPPVVMQTVPAAGDTTVSVGSQIGVRFSEKMDTAAVRSAFSIVPAIGGVISWISNNSTLLFQPSTNLPYNTIVTVSISSAAKSLYGLLLDGNRDSVGGDGFSFQFRTMSDPNSVRLRDGQLPTDYFISQNFPNPFNPVAQIRFSLPQSDFVSLIVYDIMGREMQTLVRGQFNPGWYTIDLDGSAFPSGMYFYRFKAGGMDVTKRMVIVK